MNIKACSDIFEEIRDNTLIVIPVEGSFEYRLKDDYFVYGIDPLSLHGQLIKKVGVRHFKDKVDDALIKEKKHATNEKEFSSAIRNYYPIGTCITIIHESVYYVLLVTSWIGSNGNAYITTQDRDYKLWLTKIIDDMFKYIYEHHSHKEIRIPLIGASILQSIVKEDNPIVLPELLLKKINPKKLENCHIWVKFEEYYHYMEAMNQ